MKKEEFHHLEHPIFRHHRRTFGQKASDVVTKIIGSWGFILSLISILLTWIIINGYIFIEYELGEPFDPAPFILLNLVVGCLGVIYTPIILMSQNVQSQKDRLKMEYDYQINKKSEREIREIKKLLLRRK
ncbi:MAG: DUF1003 domain-containing protein [Candidatus Nanoarchaeia archaeon]|nr:DUF1003 domain-containing protein [Candidatus Nanoarchaeia archaeon]MDD5358012.1 DUF1003 domain-containing protein [Candidatus Nanoarchaeia archaeon]MDD5588931.1 DUF1003 domain-containing protein [Candidatus Nanoarchaeia archaeon]